MASTPLSGPETHAQKLRVGGDKLNNNNRYHYRNAADNNEVCSDRRDGHTEAREHERRVEPSAIQAFYSGCCVFITGGTGFMGKILINKLLRSCPGIEAIYLLIRQKKGKDVHSRIDEIFDDPLFEKLKKEVPKFRHKIVVVPGDASLAGLGLGLADRQMLIEKTNIVIHAAATVRFDEKISLAMSINVHGVKALVDLCHSMTKLKSFVHVSTAYSNCYRKDIGEQFYNIDVSCEEVDKLLAKLDDKAMEEITPKILGPWPNTYTFTKALAEDVLLQNSKGLPVGMFRPAIVTSTLSEPLIGWTDNLYGPTGVIAGAGTGILRTLHCKSEMTANVVPVDYCVNALIASAWEISKNCHERKENNMLIYNYVSSVENPISWDLFCEYNVKYGFKHPFSTSVWYYCCTLNGSATMDKLYSYVLHYFPAVVIDGLAMCVGQKPRLLKLYRKIHKFSDVISYFCTHDWDFKNDNVQELWAKLENKDKKIFPFSMKDVDWKFYFTHYIKGMREYLFKEQATPEQALRIWRRFYILHIIFKLTVYAGLSYATWSILYRLFFRK